MLTGALLVCLMFGGPAAHATFTSAATATMTASTHAMAAPAGNTVSASCNRLSGTNKFRLKISVSKHGIVPKATDYVLRIVSPSGANTTIDLNPAGAYDSGTSNGAMRGKWTYSIEAQYRVPRSANIWASTATPLSVRC